MIVVIVPSSVSAVVENDTTSDCEPVPDEGREEVTSRRSAPLRRHHRVWIEPDESRTRVTFNARQATGRSGLGTTFTTPLVVTLAASVLPPPDTVNGS